MADVTFSQQVWLAVIDKAALGGVIVALGFFVNRKLERFKSKQVLATEIAKRRVTVAGEVWQQVAEFETVCLDEAREFAALTLAELRNAGVPGLPAASPLGSAGSLEALSRLPDQGAEIGEEAEARIAAAMVPHTTKALQKREDVQRLRVHNRFWLGSELYQSLRNYVRGFSDAFAELEPTPEGRRKFRQEYQKLGPLREDATRLLEKVSR